MGAAAMVLLDDGKAALSRSVDSLSRMAKAGTITRGMEIAGLRFASDFALGSASDGTVRVDRAALARCGCDRAISSVGAGSPAALILVGVVGQGESIAEWAALQVWGYGGRSVRPAVATGILVQALWALEAFYGDIGK